MTDAETIWAAYYDRLRLLFSNFVGDDEPGADQRFKAGIAGARTARDRALSILQEKQ